MDATSGRAKVKSKTVGGRRSGLLVKVLFGVVFRVIVVAAVIEVIISDFECAIFFI